MDQQQVVEVFVESINRHDVDAMVRLMTPDHTLIDPLSRRVTGEDALQMAWTTYFDWFPDYRIEIDRFFFDGSWIAAFGYASGSFRGRKDRHWKIPAAWATEVVNGKIKSWQVFADTHIPIQSLS
jgi:ketosteroid isomerase-like protein